MGVAYLDASALVKLVRAEPETGALRAALHTWAEHVSSVVGRLELLRAAARDSARALTQAGAVADGLSLIALDDQVRARAETLGPPELRTLDAIHVASALALEDQLAALITYDARMVSAAQAAGIAALSPAGGST